MKVSYLLLVSVFAITLVNAASGPMNAFLLSYNISQSTISSLTSTNMTSSGHSYTELFLNSRPYLLVNTTNKKSFSFVIGAGQIDGIIKNNTISTQINALGLNNLYSEVTDYMNSSASPLNDCLVETGLDRGTCTSANLCNSCSVVPACNKALYETGGPGGAFGTGIISFGANYTNLLSNESIFKDAVSGVNISDVNSKIGQINYAYNNISRITQTLPQNPIFPPPPNIDFSQCPGAANANFNVAAQGAPWYCNSVGFCEFLTYNTTQLALANSLLANINSNAPTATYTQTKAQEINSTESSIIVPLIHSEKSAQLNLLLNTTLYNYSAIANQSRALLSRMSNQSLSDSLSMFDENLSALQSNYLAANIENYSLLLSAQLSRLNSTYRQQAVIYDRIKELAANNTGTLIALQSVDNSPNASTLAFRQNDLNSQITVHIDNASQMLKNLTAVAAASASLQGIRISPTEFSRAVSGLFATAVAKALSLDYYRAVASMPILASLPSLIIGLIIFFAIFAFYVYLKGRKKIVINRRTAGAWRILFIILFALVLVYWGITYLYAVQANSGAPIQDFLSAEIASKSIGVVMNGSITNGMTNCLNIISSRAEDLNQAPPKVAYISAGKCTTNGTVSLPGACLGSFVRSGIPTIVLTSSANSSMYVYSMYGTALYASGNDTFMNQCYAAYLLR